MPFLPPSQQHQCSKGINVTIAHFYRQWYTAFAYLFAVYFYTIGHSLANCDSCPTRAKSEAKEYLQVGPIEIRYSIAWTIFVYL